MIDNTHFSDESEVQSVPEWTDEQYNHWRATGETPEVAKLKAAERAAQAKVARKRKPNLSHPAHPQTPATYGTSYDLEIDGPRLATQLECIASLMYSAQQVGQWLSLEEIADATGYTTASISAQLRHMRKREFGSHIVEKRRREAAAGGCGGTWEYRVAGKEHAEEL